jgi:hypothetical protein
MREETVIASREKQETKQQTARKLTYQKEFAARKLTVQFKDKQTEVGHGQNVKKLKHIL